MLRVCPRCEVEKDLTLFRKENGWCRECERETNLARYHNKESTKKSHKEAYRKFQIKQYGITVEDYNSMYDSQLGRCKICDSEVKPMLSGEKLSEIACIDHCHETGKVRGLLCRPCNTGLGQFKDNIFIMEKALEYLKGFEC